METHEGAVCEELDAVCRTDVGHPVQRPGINQRKLQSAAMSTGLKGDEYRIAQYGSERRRRRSVNSLINTYLNLIRYNDARKLSAYLVGADGIEVAESDGGYEAFLFQLG